jgi:Fe-S-cluster containining protein
MQRQNNSPPEAESESPDGSPLTLLDASESFLFACGPQTPCFNACCRDLEQFLTPQDVLGLARGLGMDSGAFLKEHTARHTGPRTGFPVVSLKPAGPEALCPFVSQEGCRVYPFRPGSCRAYPLVRVAARDRATGRVREDYYLVSEPHCLGARNGRALTVREWIENQGLAPYNAANDLFMELIALKNQAASGPLSLADAGLFEMACYDLDRFRAKLREGSLPGLAAVSPRARKRLAAGEGEALLCFSFKWLAHVLFGGPAPALD